MLKSSLEKNSEILPFQLIPGSQLVQGQLICRGWYSDIYKGNWYGNQVAIKQMHIKTMPQELEHIFREEMAVLFKCQFPQIVRLYGVTLEVGQYKIIMEHFPNRSLYEVLHSNETFKFHSVGHQIANDIAKGLSYLHGNQIIHKNFSSLSIFLDENYRAKISGFGMAHTRNEMKKIMSESDEESVRWLAPEIVTSREHSYLSNIYTYGMILWEMMTRQIPFGKLFKESAVVAELKAGKTEVIPNDCPQTYSEIIKLCWSEEAKRPAIQTIFNMLPKTNQNFVSKISFYQEAMTAQLYYEEGYELYLNSKYEEAIEYFKAAAEMNHPVAQNYLGYCYKMGHGITKNDNNAVHWFEKAAAQEIVDAQYQLAICYEKGWGVNQDYNKAAMWYERAATEGNEDAQLSLGWCYEIGRGVIKDQKKAAMWYEAAANKNNKVAKHYLASLYEKNKDYKKASKLYLSAAESDYARSQKNLARLYQSGKGVEKNNEQAVHWFTKAANLNNASAQFELSLCYGRGLGVQKNDAKRAFWLEKAANNGHAQAQNDFGHCYATGRGVQQNLTQAFVWYKKSADQDFPMAQYNVGLYYKAGNGVTKDPLKSVYWFTKAANLNNANAQFELAVCYDRGLGVEKNDAKRAFWLEKAANKGHSKAQNDFGHCYATGRGVDKNYTQAFAWYKKSAEQNFVLAQYNVGLYYSAGKGVAEDQEQAIIWLEKAAAQGNEKSKQLLERLRNQNNNTLLNDNCVEVKDSVRQELKK